MHLQIKCPKCGENKLATRTQGEIVLSTRCRKCGFEKTFNKPADEIKDEDYEIAN